MQIYKLGGSARAETVGIEMVFAKFVQTKLTTELKSNKVFADIRQDHQWRL